MEKRGVVLLFFSFLFCVSGSKIRGAGWEASGWRGLAGGLGVGSLLRGKWQRRLFLSSYFRKFESGVFRVRNLELGMTNWRLGN